MACIEDLLSGRNEVDSDTAGAIHFHGYQTPGGGWIIKKLDTATGKTTFHGNTTADPNFTQYASDWTNRASLLTFKQAGEFARKS